MRQNLSRGAETRTLKAFIGIAMAICALRSSSAADEPRASDLIGTWRGTSTCADRVAAPACRDEVVVYDLTADAKPGVVHWKADKVVEGKRQPMGDLDLTWDANEKCWTADFSSPRTHVVWCLVVDGAHMTGTGRQLPGKETIRRIDVRKD